MLVQATLLIQDVQLLCFTIIFGVLAMQRWGDPVRRWLWYSFLANTAGAAFDLLSGHLPLWVSCGINEEMIPLSYALLNVALLFFTRRWRKAGWISGLLLVAALPVFLAWQHAATRVRSDSLADFLIALECVITVLLLIGNKERPTRAPRLLMAGFLGFFVVVELARVFVVFLLHGNPDASGSRLAVISAVTYIVDVSLLPLAFVWMMHARLEWDLLQQSVVDPLTSVLNRRGLEQTLERELMWCRRYGGELAVAILDLDHFKALNDKHGHAAGDTILVNLAQFITHRLRKVDSVARLGGEEFVLLLPHTDLAQARLALEQLCRTLSEEAELLPSTDVRVTASIGVTSTGGRRAIGGADLVHEADVAMYDAKDNGRNQVRLFTPAEVALTAGNGMQPGASTADGMRGGARPWSASHP